MPRSATNTLILTQLPEDLLQDPQLILNVLVEHNHLCELICLKKFGRILLICENHLVAQQVFKVLRNCQALKSIYITYSMQDNEFTANLEVTEAMDYLELPSEDGSKRFLISPPLSPPPEWDHWDRVEEGPNKVAILNPDELSNILWERLGGVDSTQVRKFQQADKERDLKMEPQVLFEDVENDVPVIMLDQVDPPDLIPKPNKPVYKTSLPPTV
ncbi:calcipressin-like protein [[Candida] jaroonii]|uniref:Calcipressin-like protein n=1 Tax=[Candida] jaroonii TaxID=467808 RepID=A0ACA9Y9G1_9ASCO|nr:calcipressin-like protein [[Candida] jaroonii]